MLSETSHSFNELEWHLSYTLEFHDNVAQIFNQEIRNVF